jgi:hypothetical protein
MNMVTCIKCGSSFARTRFNGRAKYCDNCSPNKPARNMPELVCCRCKVVYGHAKRRNKRHGLDSYPCDKCKKIVERQNKAQSINAIRKRKKYLSRWGKTLLALEDEAKIYNQERGHKVYREKLFTRMRYVSSDEINMISNGKHGAPLWYDSGTQGGFEGYIRHAGFYRVDVLEDGYRSFHRVCSTGMPTHHRNNTNQVITYRIREGYSRNLEILAEIRNRKIIESLEQKRIERQNEINKKHWRKKAIQTNDVQFFRTFALVGSIQQKAQSA